MLFGHENEKEIADNLEETTENYVRYVTLMQRIKLCAVLYRSVRHNGWRDHRLYPLPTHQMTCNQPINHLASSFVIQNTVERLKKADGVGFERLYWLVTFRRDLLTLTLTAIWWV